MSLQKMWSRQPAAHSLLAPHSVEDSAPVIDSRHTVCLAWHVQKLSASINVALVGSQEVFKQPVDGMTSPPYGLAAVLRITLPGITLSNSASRPYHLSIHSSYRH